MGKPQVGFFDFTSCEGCQIELTNFGDKAFLELLNHIDIVEFREAMSETVDHLDIAFIEGSFSRESDRKAIEAIRNRADIVIAYGACASTGGITALKNYQPNCKEIVYKEDANMPQLESFAKSYPISKAIKVDYQVPGCPMNKYEFLEIVSHLLHGKLPVIPNYPVCVECKMNENICRFDDNDHCLGPIAMAGCNAFCPGDGIPCEACRGFIGSANEVAMKKVLMKRGGLSELRAETKSRMFTANLRAMG